MVERHHQPVKPTPHVSKAPAESAKVVESVATAMHGGRRELEA